MANSTDPAAKSMMDKILRSKIYQNTYWKEQCFGLTAGTLVNKAMELDHLVGTHGGNCKPTPFMWLVMKMLQIQPEKEIVIEFIKNDDYKYPSLSLSVFMNVLVMVIAFGINGLRDKIRVFKGIVIDFDGKWSVICLYSCVYVCVVLLLVDEKLEEKYKYWSYKKNIYI